MGKMNFKTYKGKPLVRKGNTIYYGTMMEPYVVMLQINNTKNIDGELLPSDVSVQLMRTEKNIKPQDMIVKRADKDGIFAALDIANIWLTRALAE